MKSTETPNVKLLIGCIADNLLLSFSLTDYPGVIRFEKNMEDLKKHFQNNNKNNISATSGQCYKENLLLA